MKIKVEMKQGMSFKSVHDGFEHIVECGSESDGELTVHTSREVTMTDVFNGVGIDAYGVRFGIAQRDNGLEIMVDGKLIVYVDHHGMITTPPTEPPEPGFTPRAGGYVSRPDGGG